LRAVEAPELDNPTHPADAEEPAEHAVIREGQEAWQRIKMTWKDWKKVGAAHVIGRTTAMREAHANKPKGTRYNAALRAWQRKFGFEGLKDKGDRGRLFDAMDHLREIDAWLAKLPDEERLRLHHPSSIWRRWKKSTATPDPVDAMSKPSPYKKLQTEHMGLIEELDRYKREVERGGGDLWSADDRPKDIAKVILGKLTKAKAEKVARAILAALKEAGK
jgi:hypothetical protein